MFEDVLIFLEPVSRELAEMGKKYWNNHLLVYTEKNDLPYGDDDFEAAMIFVNESRNAVYPKTNFLKGMELIRSKFYSLYPPGKKLRFLDLGNINEGYEPKDTYFALAKVMELLIRKNKFLFIIGAHKDLIYSQFSGYQNLEQTVNMVCLGHQVDISLEEEELKNNNYLSSIILHQPNFLFNLSVYGMQEYYVDPQKLKLMDKLYFETYRLGEFRDQPRNAEPIIRSADIMSVDLGALKNSDFPAQYEPLPNGFTSEEICLLARYGGLSDKLSSFGIYEYNAEKDNDGLGAHLIAQIIWCVLDGIQYRKSDFPSRSSDDYIRYHVLLENGKYEINFYKSRKSGRWWMEVPYPPQKGIQFERHTLIPCSEDDYNQAVKNEVPDRWLLVYNKLF